MRRRRYGADEAHEGAELAPRRTAEGLRMGVKTPSFEELAAKQAITEVIHRYGRGMDRMDKQLTLSCWHPGGTDDHAPLYSGSAEGFVEWLWPIHAAMIRTRHVMTNVLIQLDGDRAGAETYWSLVLRVPKAAEILDVVAGGRYLDRFECIDGVWAIRHRTSVLDLERVDGLTKTLADVQEALLAHATSPDVAPRPSTRDRSDHSYELVGRL